MNKNLSGYRWNRILFGWLLVGFLPAQEKEPHKENETRVFHSDVFQIREDMDPRAALELHFEERQRRAAEIYDNQRHNLPKGIKIQGSLLMVESRYHPDLIRIQSGLMVFMGYFSEDPQGGSHKLLARGFDFDDLEVLKSWLAPEKDYDRLHSQALIDLERALVRRFKGTNQIPKEEIRDYLLELRDLREKIRRNWPNDVLLSLSNHSRRVLISFIQETHIGTMGQSYRVGPITDQRVEDYLPYILEKIRVRRGEK